MQEMCRGKEKAVAAATAYGSCQCLDDHWRLDTRTQRNMVSKEQSFCIAMIADSPTHCKGKNIDRLLFTDGLRDEVQLRGEAVLSAGRSI